MLSKNFVTFSLIAYFINNYLSNIITSKMSDDDNSILSKEVQDQISALAIVSKSPYFNSI